MKNRINLITFYTIIAFSIFLCGCGKTQFTKETHKRELEFTRQFEMLTCEKPYGKLCFETDDEEEARTVETFIDNCFKVAGIEDVNNKCTLYFLTSFPANELQMAGENMFIFSLDDVINNNGNASFGRLLTYVAGCDMWISCGLAGEDTDVNEEELKEYYSNEDNRAQLSLAGLRFIDVFQDEEEIEKVKQTAIAVVKYAKKKGYKNINSISDNKAEIINGWLKSIGVDYSLEECSADKVKYFVGPEDEKLDYILIDNLALYIKGSPYNGWEVNNINQLDRYFSTISDDLKGIRDFVTDNNILDNEAVNKPVRCEWSGAHALGTSFAKPDSNTILLQAWVALPHEYTHIYFTYLNRTNHEFLNEGIAEYLGSYLNGTAMREYYVSYYTDEANKDDPAYDLINENMDVTENFDLMTESRLFIKSSDFLDEYAVPLLSEDGWSYQESGVFVGYLIENYSVDEFMKIFTSEGRDMEENEAVLQRYVDEWRESLKD